MTDMMLVSDFKQIIDNQGVKKETLGEIWGVSRNTVYYYLGKKFIEKEKTQKVFDYLKIDINEYQITDMLDVLEDNDTNYSIENQTLTIKEHVRIVREKDRIINSLKVVVKELTNSI